MKEEWRPVEEFDGAYEVSNLGRVKNVRFGNQWGVFNRDRIMQLTDLGDGYLGVNLFKDGKNYMRRVHRLVAEAFCEKKAGCNVVNHIDYNRANNVWTNLEWCTTAENVRYSAEHMRVRQKIRTVPKKGNKTGELGIYKVDNKYVVVVCRTRYGRYKTIEEAVRVRDEALTKHIKEWSK